MSVQINVPEDVSRKAYLFLEKVFGPVGDVSDILSDNIRFFRWKNLIKIIEKAEAMSREAELNQNKVPLKFLIPFLEEASLEEDDDLSKMWAALLSSASNKFSDHHKLLKNILSDLSVDEALFLNKLQGDSPFIKSQHSTIMFENFNYKTKSEMVNSFLESIYNKIYIDDVNYSGNLEDFFGGLQDIFKLDGSMIYLATYHGDNVGPDSQMICAQFFEDNEFSITHLKTLGLVTETKYIFDSKDHMSNPQSFHLEINVVTISPLGVDFVVTCSSKRVFKPMTKDNG